MASHNVDRSDSTVMINRRYNSSPSSSCKRLTALGFTFLAVISPVLMDRRRKLSLAEEIELEDQQPFSLSSYLPLVLLGLSMGIVFSDYRNHSFWNRFDPYWIHRTVGSSLGIVFFLIVLALVLKFKDI
ncbi:uncharacterized protein LOC124912657 [Impatiens glandulifera]|uniref:uncharacterized protein LOC124912657 n=1 Tax=Impatiens glandulifera TaxID=253017 RepID=UPI001FB154F4|nr:uncharacterized protein LOC124912657 [Impatiens glandulifera]